MNQVIIHCGKPQTKQPQLSLPPIKQDNGNWTKSNKEKAELFADHLEKVFVESEQQIPTKEEEYIHRSLDATHQLELPIKKFTYLEVKNVIKNDLNSKKNSGYDLIT